MATARLEHVASAQQIVPCAAWPCFPLLAAYFLITGCETSDQQHVREYNQEGVHLFKQGNYQSARENFAAALELNPKDSALLYNLGQCYDRLGDTAKGEDYYSRCLEISTNHADCRYALAALEYRAGKKQKANDMIQQWLAAEPKLADPYALDGWRLRQENAWPQALGRFNQAIAIDPHNVRANVELAIYYEQTSYPERARLCYERALQMNPTQPEVTERLNALKSKKVGRPLPD
jgi:Tfp pilus assembly protein PilF